MNENTGRSTTRTLFAVLVLAVAVLGWFQYRGSSPNIEVPVAVEYVDSIAVLPLDNLTGDPEFDHVGMGITEQIIAHLARIPPLKVISRHSVQAIGDQNLTFPQLGNLLQVRHIIDGTVQTEGDTLVVTLRHTDAQSNARIWTQEIRGPLGDLVGVQEEIARFATAKVVDTLPGVDAPADNSHPGGGPGQEAYLTGREWLGLRTFDGLNNAIKEFDRAIALDPGYAAPYADMASAYALAVFYRYDIGDANPYELAARSLALAERSLALDPNLAAGFAARGYLGALVGQAADEVAADFDRAASLQPNAASIPSWRARSLAQLGKFDEAVSEASRAIELDPLAPGRHIALAELSLQLGNYDQAISSARSATALEPGIIRSRSIEARALLLRGDAEACAELPLGPHRVLHATCLEASGQSAEAEAIITEVLDDIRKDRKPGNGYAEVIQFEDLAVDFAMRGDARNALFWAATAYSASPVGVEIRILESALFDKVRDDPDFSASIASIRGDLYDRVRRDSERLR